MSTVDEHELRRLAEAATEAYNKWRADGGYANKTVDDFIGAVSPTAVIALLDEMERLRARTR